MDSVEQDSKPSSSCDYMKRKQPLQYVQSWRLGQETSLQAKGVTAHYCMTLNCYSFPCTVELPITDPADTHYIMHKSCGTD